MKGLTITSEIIMALGMIVLAVVFSLVSSQVIGSQQSGILSGAQASMAEEIARNIEEAGSFTGSTQITYQPPIDLYTLQARQGRIEVDIEGEETREVRIQTAELEENTLENAENICITRGDKVTLKEGKCESIDVSELCEDGGCSPNQCKPEAGEDCSSAGCSCGEQGSPASSECAYDHDPNYDPNYINPSGDPEPVVDLSCINEEYVGVQEEGDRCEYNFECSASLSCNPAAPSGPGKSHCCPQGKQWNGSQCIESNVMHVTFMPVNFDPGEIDNPMGGYPSYSDMISDVKSEFKAKTPLKECSNPDNHVKFHVVDKTDVETDADCNIDNCQCDISNPSTCQNCKNEMTQCKNSATNAPPGTKVHGFCEGASCGQFGGVANTPGVWGVTNVGTVVPDETALHELGHNFHLNHIEACGNPSDACEPKNANDCNEPQSAKEDFLLSYCNNRDKYGPSGYEHLKNNEFDQFAGECY